MRFCLYLPPLPIAAKKSPLSVLLPNANHISFWLSYFAHLNNRLSLRFARYGLQDRFFRLLIKVHALPHFNHQQGPYLQSIVTAVLFMVAQEFLHRVWAE